MIPVFETHQAVVDASAVVGHEQEHLRLRRWVDAPPAGTLDARADEEFARFPTLVG